MLTELQSADWLNLRRRERRGDTLTRAEKSRLRRFNRKIIEEGNAEYRYYLAIIMPAAILGLSLLLFGPR